ncbi:MAG: choice-of-anchor J domain-containing protein [Bacteroidetes bacterium]|nr:choice-of-anchor J domain-containing protein [Bacteroidota bacterium]
MNFRNSILTLLIGSLALIGCKKDFDSPPVAVLPAGNIITIDSLRKIYTSFDSTIVNDLSVYGTVTADELSGNLYKTIYIQDETAGILLKLTASNSHSFFEGDRVRVSLKGTLISNYKNMIQLGDVNPEIHIIKQSKGNSIAPKVVTISDLTVFTGTYTPYQGQLIQLNNVEFSCSDICNTYGDAVSQTNVNITLTDTLGKTIIVRTSGYASFAGTPIQQGRGSFVAIVSQFLTTIQLTIRKLDDLTLSGGIGTLGGGTYAQISNYAGGNSASEAWLISPTMDLSATNAPYLTFNNAWKYTGSALKLFVTTNYTGNASTTTWTDITSSATWSAGNFAWTPSGNVSLMAYKQAGVRFAFKYVGTAVDGSTWELDNILVKDI